MFCRHWLVLSTEGVYNVKHARSKNRIESADTRPSSLRIPAYYTFSLLAPCLLSVSIWKVSAQNVFSLAPRIVFLSIESYLQIYRSYIYQRLVHNSSALALFSDELESNFSFVFTNILFSVSRRIEILSRSNRGSVIAFSATSFLSNILLSFSFLILCMFTSSSK